METSILKTIRTAVGIQTDFTGFDEELIVAINTALMSLSQLGIGPVGGFSISDDTSVWDDLFNGETNIEGAKSYILLKVKLEFDPPGTSFVLEAMTRQLEELSCRLMIEVDPDYVPAE